MSFFGSSIDKSKWQIDVCGLDGSHPTGSGRVFNASSKNFSYMINAGRQMVWSMTLDNPRVPYILNNDCLAKVYRINRLGNKQLLMVGDILSTEEKAEGDTGVVTCTAADPFWRLGFRYLGVGTDSHGRGVGYVLGNPATNTPVDLSNMLANIIVVAADFGGYPHGIQQGTIQLSGQTQYLGPLYAVTASDTIQQIVQTTGAPDFEIVPMEPSGAWPATIIGTFNVHTHLGTLTPSVTFEYGIGKHSMATYSRIVTKNNMANYVFSLPQGFPTMSAANDTTVVSQDNTSIGARGLFQYYTNDNLVAKLLRQALTDETLTVLKQARQQLSITPTVDSPIDFGADYNVGDIVGARAWDGLTKSWRFGGTIRVFGVQISADENDAESTTITCTPDVGAGTTFPSIS